MSARNPANWSPNTLAALSGPIREDMQRPPLEGGGVFPPRFLAVRAAHQEAFGRGVDLLARYGGAGYIHQDGGPSYTRDPLTTGYLAVGDVVTITRSGKTSICVPAVRIGIEQPNADLTAALRAGDIRQWVQPQNESIGHKINDIKKHVGTLSVRAALLATYTSDINPPSSVDVEAWGKNVLERRALGPVAERLSKLRRNCYISGPSYIQHALTKPDVSMWSIRLPELTASGHNKETFYVRKNLLPYSSENSITGAYDRMSEGELATHESELPILDCVTDLLKRASTMSQPVRDLGEPARKVIPS